MPVNGEDENDLQQVIREKILSQTIKQEPDEKAFEDVKNEVLSMLHKNFDAPSTSSSASENQESEDTSEFEIDFDHSIDMVVKQGLLESQIAKQFAADKPNYDMVTMVLTQAQKQLEQTQALETSASSSLQGDEKPKKYRKYEYPILDQLNAKKLEEQMSDPKIDPHMRAIILYEFKTGHSSTEATNNINKAYGPDSITKSAVQSWFKRFRGGDSKTRDRRGGRKLLLRHCEEDLIDALVANPKITLQKLSEMFGVGVSTIFNQLRRLGIKKTKEGWK
ncbi:unnamed protein product [Bursaphelenchus okinawaensis]|uniref:Mos1 transposase HTH domain-containing protein n=1 Tax=Bursaphelenchus okinawaensis TaxID=465554 RepID=A0A811KAD7_9BILA|nr:unnamed protein product [Bursaphelenchus okinawaensis]CAG9099524.1 unnamed protein product [Bursaphelenchus okinawaensis]